MWICRCPKEHSLNELQVRFKVWRHIITEITGDNLELLYSEMGPTSGMSAGGANVFDDQNMATIKVKLEPESKMAASHTDRCLTDYFQRKSQLFSPVPPGGDCPSDHPWYQ